MSIRKRAAFTAAALLLAVSQVGNCVYAYSGGTTAGLSGAASTGTLAGSETLASTGTSVSTQNSADNDSETVIEESLNNYEDVNTDNTKNPGFSLVQANADAEDIDLTQQALADTISEWTDIILNRQLMTSDELMPLLNAAEETLQGTSSSLTLQSNALNLVEAEKVETNGSKDDYIYVIDENAYAVLVKDGENSYISNALVTISYMDEDGHQQTRSTRTSGGNVPGIAAFDDMQGFRYGVLDIQAEGYNKVTLLQEDMTGGNKRTILLEKEKSNSYYLRAADLNGKDLLTSDTTITLMESEQDQELLTFLVTATGNLSAPGSLTLISTTDGRTIATLTDRAVYSEDTQTWMFQLKADWIMQNKDLLKEGDKLAVEVNGMQLPLSYVTVKNAMVEPVFDPDADIPITDQLTADFDGAFPGSGNISFSANILNFTGGFGIFPNGKFCIFGSYDLDKSKDQFSTLFPKTGDPKVAEGTEKIIDQLKDSVSKNVEKIQKGTGTIKDAGHLFFVDSNGKVSAGFSACFTGSYNEKTKLYEGDFTFAMYAKGNIGQNFYFIVAAGPLTLPGYIGYEWGLEFKASSGLHPTATSIYPLDGVALDKTRSIAYAIHLLPSFAAYIGAGIRGVAGLELNGSIGADVGVVAARYDNDDDLLHGFVDVSANLTLKYYYVMGTDSVNLWSILKKRIFDSWSKNYSLQNDTLESEEEYILEHTGLEAIDLSACEEDVANENSGTLTGELGILPTYENTESYELDSSTSLIQSDTLIDNQIQIVTTKNQTALFRIISKDNTTKLVYQLQDKTTGKFETTLHEVQVPDGQAVFEYKASGVKVTYLGDKGDYVYIAAVCGDISKTDMSERAFSTSVAGITVDLAQDSELYCEQLSPASQTGSRCYFNCQPAGHWEQCIVSYSVSDSYETRDQYINYMTNLAGEEIFLSENVPVFCIGNASTDTDCTFWTKDADRSTDETYVCKAFNNKGTSPDTGLFELNIDISDEDSEDCPISCVGYLASTTYMIINNKLYALQIADDHSGWTLKEMTYRTGKSAVFNGTDTSYTMCTDTSNSMIYIVSVTSNYETDPETLSTTRAGSTVHISYIADTFSSYYGHLLTLHGEREYDFDDVDMTVYSVGYTKKSDTNGLVMAYDVASAAGTCNDLYEWQEEARNGLTLTEFYVDDPLITNTEKYMSATITYRNDGYALEGPVRFIVTDSEGNVLQQALYDSVHDTYEDLNPDQGYWMVNLYPSDSYTQKLYFKTNPNWKTNAEQKITVTLVGDDTAEESSLSVSVDEPYYTLQGRQTVSCGIHIGELSIANACVVEGAMPKIAIVARYDDANEVSDASEGNEVSASAQNADSQFAVLNEDGEKLSSSENLISVISKGSTILQNRNIAANSYSSQSYNTDINLEEIWKAYEGTGLMGVYVYLMDEDGNEVDNHSIYFENPYYAYAPEESEPESGSDESEETAEETRDVTASDAEASKASGADGEGTNPADTGDRIDLGVLSIMAVAGIMAAVILIRRKSRNY